MTDAILIDLTDAVMTVRLNRPESHNALTPGMVIDLTTLFLSLAERDDVRVVVLTGNGRSFCAGADLGAMRAAADFSYEENVADGEAIFDLMNAIDRCPHPTVARVNGAAIGGGAGLISCCDIVVAVDRAVFAFSETRLGIVPAVISPFVLAKIGPAHARELFLTGERFDAGRALQAGLVQHVTTPDELDEMVDNRVQQLLQCAPGAQAAAKRLIHAVAYHSTDSVREFTTNLIAERRASDEGREGMSAFLEKRLPWWQVRSG